MTEIIYNRPTTILPEKWDGTMIQSDRYEIHLNFGDEGGDLCVLDRDLQEVWISGVKYEKNT